MWWQVAGGCRKTLLSMYIKSKYKTYTLIIGNICHYLQPATCKIDMKTVKWQDVSIKYRPCGQKRQDEMTEQNWTQPPFQSTWPALWGPSKEPRLYFTNSRSALLRVRAPPGSDNRLHRLSGFDNLSSRKPMFSSVLRVDVVC